MFGWTADIDLDCDAPAYSVVHACKTVGVERPEDVRWCHWTRRGVRRTAGWFHVGNWRSLFRRPSPDDTRCSCGETLPCLEECLFSCVSGEAVTYLLGQCRRCGTVFWQET
jgi:hypothetical protein